MRLVDADILIAELKESALHHCNNPREDCLLQRDRVIVRAQPTVEAIPKDQYEARLRADMAAMLTEIQLEIKELWDNRYDVWLDNQYYIGKSDTLEEVDEVIQQKIDALKVIKDGNNN